MLSQFSDAEAECDAVHKGRVAAEFFRDFVGFLYIFARDLVSPQRVSIQNQ